MKFNSLMKRICLVMLFVVGVLSAAALAQQSGGAASGGAMSGGAVSGGAVLIPNYTPVTQQRLENPEPKNWLIYKGNYSTWGYSPLDQINMDNVYSLKPVWTFSTGEVEGHEGAPIVNNGIMFATGAYDTLFALNAKTGKLIWSYRRNLPKDVYYEDCCGVVNRGVALYGNDVYMATLDAHLLAFNAKTGKIVWDTKVANYKDGYTMTLAPLAAKGKIVVGVAGGEYGIRGFLEAFDAKTGKSIWKTYTVAGPKQPGGYTWPGDTYKHGGGSIWNIGSYDPATNLLYWGIGNGGPFGAVFRYGDNLFTSSVLALNLKTGKIEGYYQYNPNGSWDYDAISDQTLVTVKRNGKKMKGLIHAGRNGYFYLLNRSGVSASGGTISNSAIRAGAVSGGTASGSAASGGAVSGGAASGGALPSVPASDAAVSVGLKFVYATPEMKSSDKTITGFTDNGRPIVPAKHYPGGLNKPVFVCPFFQGADNWEGLSYDPETGYAYIPTTEECMNETTYNVSYAAGQLYTGAKGQKKPPKNLDMTGALQAIDVATGKVAWRDNQKLPDRSPTLATGGGLVFNGDVASDEFRAYNAKTGEELWHFKTNSGVVGVPTSFKVDGVQYIAVESGVGGNASKDIGAMASAFNIPYTRLQGGMIWVFALAPKNRQSTGAQSGGQSGGAMSGGQQSGSSSGGQSGGGQSGG